jgi:hypothetical protein
MFAWVLDRLPGLEFVHVVLDINMVSGGLSVVEKGLAISQKCSLSAVCWIQASLYYRGGAKRKGGDARIVCVLYERIHH